MSKTDAIRVIVGDGSRVDRDLVRFMLERDGFRVISSVAASEDLGRAASVMQPDAVVLGEELLDVAGGEAARLVRDTSPDAKIVLFSGLPAAAAAGPGAPDAVLERGIGLKDLTPTLSNLFKPLAVVGASAAGAAAANIAIPQTPTTVDTPAPIEAANTPADTSRRPLVVVTAAAAALILMIFVIARVVPVDRTAERSAATTPPTVSGIGAAVSPGGAGPNLSAGASSTGQETLDAAFTTLDKLKQAIQAGSYFDVTRLARQLILERTAAQAAGADVGELNQGITETLSPIVASLSPFVAGALRGILGPLLPVPNLALGTPSPNSSGNRGGSAGTALPGITTLPQITPPSGTGGSPSGGEGGGGTHDSHGGSGSGPTQRPVPTGAQQTDVLGGGENPSTTEANSTNSTAPNGAQCPKPGNGGGNGQCQDHGVGTHDPATSPGQSNAGGDGPDSGAPSGRSDGHSADGAQAGWTAEGTGEDGSEADDVDDRSADEGDSSTSSDVETTHVSQDSAAADHGDSGSAGPSGD